MNDKENHKLSSLSTDQLKIFEKTTNIADFIKSKISFIFFVNKKEFTNNLYEIRLIQLFNRN